MAEAPQVLTVTDSAHLSRYLAALNQQDFDQAIVRVDELYTVAGQVHKTLLEVYSELSDWLERNKEKLSVAALSL